jgi:hypothetical protein
MPKTKNQSRANPRTETRTKTGEKTGTGTSDKAPAKAIRGVEKQIVAKFPEMKGVRPNVVRRRVPEEADLLSMIEKINGELGAKLSVGKGKVAMNEIYLASFEKEMKSERGTVLRRIVRVTFDRDGHILKLVSSK